jgi:nicotinamidase-related amidase
VNRLIEIPEYEVHTEVRVDPSRTALVVVDMQNDFVHQGGGLLVPDAEATIPAINKLLQFAREHEIRVVYSQDTHRRGDPEWRTWPEHAREGSWGWEIVDELAPAREDLVLRKLRYDAFYGTSLDHELRQRRIASVIVAGTVSNICVLHTAGSAALRGLQIVVPVDAVSALTDFDQHAALRQVTFLYRGTLTRSDGIVAVAG